MGYCGSLAAVFGYSAAGDTGSDQPQSGKKRLSPPGPSLMGTATDAGCPAKQTTGMCPALFTMLIHHCTALDILDINRFIAHVTQGLVARPIFLLCFAAPPLKNQRHISDLRCVAHRSKGIRIMLDDCRPSEHSHGAIQKPQKNMWLGWKCFRTLYGSEFPRSWTNLRMFVEGDQLRWGGSKHVTSGQETSPIGVCGCG